MPTFVARPGLPFDTVQDARTAPVPGRLPRRAPGQLLARLRAAEAAAITDGRAFDWFNRPRRAA